LPDEDREVIIARIELDFPYSKVAEVLGKSSADEARKAAIQALLRLAREMGNST
jgi:DNA-directed RNA polymerase specialized sigma24 family protein